MRRIAALAGSVTALVAALTATGTATAQPPAGIGAQAARAGLCAVAQRRGYVPKRDVCSDALWADVDGDGRRELVLVYGRQITGAGASLKAYGQTLEVVRADGRLIRASLRPSIPGPSVVAVGTPGALRGAALFVAMDWSSSGPEVRVYTVAHGKLLDAGATLSMGGDSANRFGFQCVTAPKPEVIQNDYALIGPNIYGRWRLTSYTYVWAGHTLQPAGHAVSIHVGWPDGVATRPGPGCGPLPVYR